MRSINTVQPRLAQVSSNQAYFIVDYAPEIRNQPRTVNVESWIKCPKRTKRDLSRGEQKLLVEVYEEYKHIITSKRNAVTIDKNREATWQTICRSVECISSIKLNLLYLNIDNGF